MWLPGTGSRSGAGLLESMLEDPPDTPWAKWGSGVAVPSVLALWGCRVMWLQNTVLGFGRRKVEMAGPGAWWIGVAILGVAGWFHFHYFWTNHPKLWRYAELGKITALIALLVGIGMGCFNQFRLI